MSRKSGRALPRVEARLNNSPGRFIIIGTSKIIRSLHLSVSVAHRLQLLIIFLSQLVRLMQRNVAEITAEIPSLSKAAFTFHTINRFSCRYWSQIYPLDFDYSWSLSLQATPVSRRFRKSQLRISLEFAEDKAEQIGHTETLSRR